MHRKTAHFPVELPARPETGRTAARPGADGVKKTNAGCIFIAAAAFLVLLCAGTRLHAAEIAAMSISNTEENLILSVTIDGAFTERMQEAILSGISTSFSYVITVTRKRALFPDKQVHEINLTHTVKYDTLRKTFTVRRSWENYRPLTTDTFAEAKRWMSQIQDVPVIPLESLDKDTRYRINAKAELDRVTLPFFLNYVFFFLSLWDFETDWHSIDFVY